MSSKSMSQIFKILVQTGNINTFAILPFMLSYSRSVQLKSFFSVEESSGKI